MVAAKLRQRVIDNVGYNRVYAMKLPDVVTLPAITFQRVSSVAWSDHEGAAQLFTSRWQYLVIASRYADAIEAGNAIIEALDGWRDATSPRVERAMLENDIDTYDPEAQQYRRMIDFMVDHELE